VTLASLALAGEGLLLPQDARQIAQRAFPSVVLVLTHDTQGQPLALGSGFFVRPDIVATNLHVIEGAAGGWAKIVGQPTKYEIEGTVAVDEERDPVLFKVNGAKAIPLELGDSNKVQVGDPVFVVGNPRGLEGTLSQGIVSAIRSVERDTLLQVTAPISPGSSGRPVLDAQGNVIGIAIATLSGGQNLNFAIPVSNLSALLLNMKPTVRLTPDAPSRGDRSIVRRFGTKSIEGVAVTHFTWDGYSHYFSFSVHNQLADPVRNVHCLVIFYDEQGDPIDFTDEHVFSGTATIPPGLAARWPFRGPVTEYVKENAKRVEFRVLDFEIVGDSDTQ
jgi:hypothetical protein